MSFDDGNILDSNRSLHVAAANFEGEQLILGGETYYVFQKAFGVPVSVWAAQLPAYGSGGFAPGCTLYYGSGLTLGACPVFMNYGTVTACNFIPISSQIGYGITYAGQQTSAGGDATETILVYNTDATFDKAMVGHHTTNDTDNLLSTILTDNTITITGSADPSTAHGYNYLVFRAGCRANYDIVFAGTVASTGDATQEIALTGALSTDMGYACYSVTDDTDTIAGVAMTTNTMTITCSADPSTTHGFHYAVLRPRGTRQPSHYIAYAGQHTTVGGAAAEAITVTGALSTDTALVSYAVTNDTDTILKSVVTANTLTVTMSADPSTAHALTYLILREY
jgi:hypothetical protein